MPEVVTAVASPPAPAHTMLPEAHRLLGAENWDIFDLVFPVLLEDSGLWDAVNHQPSSACPRSVVLKNIAVDLLEIVREGATSAAMWSLLRKQFSAKTTNTKLKSLSTVIQHRPTGKMSDAFVAHAKNRRAFIAAFESKIDRGALVDLIFINMLPDRFAPIRAVEQAKEVFDFSSLRSSIIAEDDRQDQPTAKLTTTPAATTTIGRCKHRHGIAATCWKCHPEKAPVCAHCLAANRPRTQHLTAECRGGRPATASIAVANIAFTPDSGCSDHILSNKDVFDCYSNVVSSVALANGSFMPSAGRGDVLIQTLIGPARLRDAIICPTLTTNLLSISKLDDHGLTSVFSNKSFYVFRSDIISEFIKTHSGDVVMKSGKCGSLYEVNLELSRPTTSDLPQSLLCLQSKRSMNDWHMALNHINIPALRKTMKMVDGIEHSDKSRCDCIACIVGKSVSQSFPPSTRQVIRIGELVSSDWWGPVATPSHEGCKYF